MMPRAALNPITVKGGGGFSVAEGLPHTARVRCWLMSWDQKKLFFLPNPLLPWQPFLQSGSRLSLDVFTP